MTEFTSSQYHIPCKYSNKQLICLDSKESLDKLMYFDIEKWIFYYNGLWYCKF